MVNKKINFPLFVAILILITACDTTSAPTQPVISTSEPPQAQLSFPQTEAQVPRVTVEDAKAALDSGKAVIVDVRSPALFDIEHAAGAISIPLALIESDATSLDLDKKQWIITYCT